MTAKLLGKAIGLPHSKALEVVAQALRFRSWHDMSSHLTRLAETEPEMVSEALLDALSVAVVMTAWIDRLAPVPLAHPLRASRFACANADAQTRDC